MEPVHETVSWQVFTDGASSPDGRGGWAFLAGRIEPGRVFDRSVILDDVPDGYRAMNEREAIKVMVEF